MTDRRLILGIDPGIRGGLSILVIEDGTAPQLVDAIDIPVAGTAAKERVDPIAIRNWLATHRPVHAFIERAQSYPKQGISSAFKYGAAYGSLLATITLCEIPLTIVEPSLWKKHFHLRGKDKEAARQKGLELFPAGHGLLALRKHHGRAESALVALYGARA
jgi:crossover junction endodeoxyribonuclease RuvC